MTYGHRESEALLHEGKVAFGDMTFEMSKADWDSLILGEKNLICLRTIGVS